MIPISAHFDFVDSDSSKNSSDSGIDSGTLVKKMQLDIDVSPPAFSKTTCRTDGLVQKKWSQSVT